MHDRRCFGCVAFILIAILTHEPASSQTNTPWLYIGEYSEYDLSYFGIPASKICFHLADTLHLDSTAAFKLNVTTQTTGVWSGLFRLDNIYESTIDLNTDLPIAYYKRINQKNIQQEWTLRFDQMNHVASIDAEKSWSIPPNCHNFFSMIYAIRRSNFAITDTLQFHLDVESLIWEVRMVKRGIESIDVPAGNFEAVKFEVDFIPLKKGSKRAWKTDLLTNRLARENSSGAMWFSNDEYKTLLKIHYKQSINSLKVQLRGVHPSKQN
ncbi:DUF3108 domain-containing protein [candidate division KSB1 bacterium]|nr:DUF3108 domain-containing protein [candidate division KSB1 bacterium]